MAGDAGRLALIHTVAGLVPRFRELAAELMPDAEVDAASLRGRVEGLLEDGGRRDQMAQRIRNLATPHAAGEVADKLLRARGKEQGS